MKLKGMKALSLSATIIQGVTVLIIIVMTLLQPVLRELNGTNLYRTRENVIPIGLFIQTISFLIVYMIGLVIMMVSKQQRTKQKVIVLLIIAGVLRLFVSYSALMNGIIIKQMGITTYNSYVVLENSIKTVISPLTTIALMLFCVSCGGYYGMEDKD